MSDQPPSPGSSIHLRVVLELVTHDTGGAHRNLGPVWAELFEPPLNFTESFRTEFTCTAGPDGKRQVVDGPRVDFGLPPNPLQNSPGSSLEERLRIREGLPPPRA